MNSDVTIAKVAQHVLQRAAHEEELLHQPQPAAGIVAIVGVEHLGKGFTTHLLLHGAIEIAAVEGMEIKRLGRLRLPQPQPVAAVDAIAEHRHVMGDADGLFGGNPAHPVLALVVVPYLRVASEADPAAHGRLHQLPGPAALEPLVGDLHLPAVPDRLVEDAELVADAVAGGRDLKSGEGFEEASCQTAEAAVAQSRLLLKGEDLLDVIDAEALQGCGSLRLDAEHQQVVAQLGADQELRREVRHRPRPMVRPEGILGGQLSAHQPIPYGITQRHVEIVGTSAAHSATEGKEEVLGDALV